VTNENFGVSAWAKSVRDENGSVVGWLPLFQHLDDTMATAGFLIDRWVSPQVKERITREVPGGATGLGGLSRWLAGTHDVGKASPAFACQVDVLADRMRSEGFRMDPRLADDPGRRAAGHALVGYWAVREWLADEAGFDFNGTAAQWASVAGSHHGVPPEESQLSYIDESPHLTGSGTWSATRRWLLRRASDSIGGIDVLRHFRDVDLSVPVQSLLTAIVVVADWIASNPDLFPLYPLSRIDVCPDDAETARRADAAWTALDLPPAWTPTRPGNDVDQLFRERFARPSGTARPVQVAAVELAWALPEPGLLVIEAPMGSGKTEAALLAAEVLAYRSGADGVFVALPTQATTDAMYDRVRAWLDAVPAEHRRTVALAHGKAHLNDDYAGLVRKGRFAAIGDDDTEAVVAHWWLSGRKKSALASFVVGTIDQVLFGALKSRHVMLRHLALAGKVVIIDEVHAYDVYMSQYLHRVLHWLGAYGVPVVLLSETLPQERREELLAAYRSGRGLPGRPASRSVEYPVVCGTGVEARAVPATGQPTRIMLDHLDDDLDAVVGYLCTHLADGGCAVVVRNTVGRVQETAQRLSTEFGADAVTVSHSRFLACDRMRIDKGLVRQFGPPESNPDRPGLHIVVASQVVEQSLDVDFDLMVTDLAPADLVLQRLAGAQDWSAAPVTAIRGSRRVCGKHLLLCSAALLAPREFLWLLTDIAPLAQRAYNGATSRSDHPRDRSHDGRGRGRRGAGRGAAARGAGRGVPARRRSPAGHAGRLVARRGRQRARGRPKRRSSGPGRCRIPLKCWP
jgi:CRISPR-associated endonuclease/helicase Cas3